MEGVSNEAASLAGHLGLGRSPTSTTTTTSPSTGAPTSPSARTSSPGSTRYGWHTQRVEDGTDLDAIRAAIAAADADDRPSLIAVRTVIGYGSPNKAGTSSSHGSPLGEDEIRATKEALGWPHTEPFTVPDDVREHLDRRDEGRACREDWEARFAAYRDAHPDLAAEFERRVIRGELPDGWTDALPTLDGKDATRKHSGRSSTRSPTGSPSCSAARPTSRRPTTPTSRVAATSAPTDPARPQPAVRDPRTRDGVDGQRDGAARRGDPLRRHLPHLHRLLPAGAAPVGPDEAAGVYVMTHDSIGLGEDGPTHQPIEHLPALRAIPGLTVLRPADGDETVGAWKVALESDGAIGDRADASGAAAARATSRPTRSSAAPTWSAT
jgi:transketolase